jgi:HD-like signal output (HDOD) protein
MLAILEEILLDIERLDPFPATATRVLEVIAQSRLDPDEEIDALMPLVLSDPGMTTRVLRAANSAVRGSGTPIDSVHRACIELGSDRTASLALASVVACRFMGLGGSTIRSNHSLWEESLTTATACRLIGERCDYRDVELAFTAGLLQNMAFIVMDRFLRQQREEIQSRIDLGLGWLTVEREVLGVAHPFIGAKIARKWQLPAVLVDVIQNHHSPTRSTCDADLCKIAGIGEALAWAVLGDSQHPRITHRTSVSLSDDLGLSDAELGDLMRCLPAEMATTKAWLDLD